MRFKTSRHCPSVLYSKSSKMIEDYLDFFHNLIQRISSLSKDGKIGRLGIRKRVENDSAGQGRTGNEWKGSADEIKGKIGTMQGLMDHKIQF